MCPRNSKVFSEIGLKALPNSKYKALEALSPVERGRELVRQQGWLKAVLKVHLVKAARLSGTGPTPTVRMVLSPSNLLTLRAALVSATASKPAGNAE